MNELFESILTAAYGYVYSQDKHDNAISDCREDWEYFGHREIEELNNSKQKFKETIDNYIDERIKLILEKL